jgi:hypothetical protein
VLNDVKSRVDAIQNFAESVEKPIIADVLLKNQVMSLAVTADTDERTLRALAEAVRDDLLAFAGKSPENGLERMTQRPHQRQCSARRASRRSPSRACATTRSRSRSRRTR